MVLHHCLVYPSSRCSLPKLNIGHHQMLFIGIPEHVFQVFLESDSQQESTSYLLDFNDLLPSLIEVDFYIISGAVSSIQALDQNTRTVSFENSSETINIYFKVKKMLFGTFLFSVVWDM